jgi:hypothetical protein
MSCRKAHDPYGITWGSGNISYDISLNATFFMITFTVSNWTDVDARITAWRLVFRSGETQLLEVNSKNYQSYAPFVNCPDTIYQQTLGVFTMQSNDPSDLANSHPCQGKVFSSAAPDSMHVFVTLSDTDGNEETVEQNLEVFYSNID